MKQLKSIVVCGETIPLTNIKEVMCKKHLNKYTYTDEIIHSPSQKITITCPQHGEFTQTVYSHLVGKGCKLCGYIKSVNKTRDTLDTFIDKARIVHGDKFDYSKAVYINSSTKIIITCPIHGDFEQKPYKHLQRKLACRKCANSHLSTSQASTTDTFIHKANIVHSNIYSYEKTQYTRAFKPVIITCPIHGDFEQEANSHLQGHGCRMCNPTGFDKSKPAILYYLKINGGQAYKIGITNKSIQERFSNSDLKVIETIATKYYEIGKDAYDAEQVIIKEYADMKYTGIPILESGNTELFKIDIFGSTNILDCYKPISTSDNESL